MIVVLPTRELAIQVAKDFIDIGQGLRCTCIYGGSDYAPQERDLRRGVEVVVGTPGRLIDHLEKGNLKVGTARVVQLASCVHECCVCRAYVLRTVVRMQICRARRG